MTPTTETTIIIIERAMRFVATTLPVLFSKAASFIAFGSLSSSAIFFSFASLNSTAAFSHKVRKAISNITAAQTPIPIHSRPTSSIKKIPSLSHRRKSSPFYHILFIIGNICFFVNRYCHNFSHSA